MIVRHLRNLWLTGAGNNRPDPFFLNTHFSGDLKVSDLARLKTRANQPVAGYQLIIRKWQDYKIRVRLQRGENQPQARIIFPRPYAREADHLKPAYPAPKSNL